VVAVAKVAVVTLRTRHTQRLNACEK
jgi:hypothetical protein